MRIAIAASQNQLNSPVDPHFGRCEWYCIFDTETKAFEFIENTSRHQTEKAGCEAVSLLFDKGITAAIAGRFGSKVMAAFNANQVQMIVPENKMILNEIINQFK
jgi:predicted Fe-Mo cluster-binding NifX family protein